LNAGSIFIAANAPMFTTIALTNNFTENSLVYLARFNLDSRHFFAGYGVQFGFNLTDVNLSLNSSNTVYSSGNCVVLQLPR
jgi:hypothetical protein